jgi:hypothetical protein
MAAAQLRRARFSKKPAPAPAHSRSAARVVGMIVDADGFESCEV